MKKLYCPECLNYLMGGSGEMNDCGCGWTQPEDKVECGGCGDYHYSSQITQCNTCYTDKCPTCDMGDDTDCANCPDEDDTD